MSVRPVDARGFQAGVVLHAAIVLAAGTSLAGGSDVFDAVGLLLLAAAVAGYLTARVANAGFDAAHTAFVGGAVGGLLAAAIFVSGVRADATAGVYWQVQYALATAGLPSWLVANHGDVVVILVGLLLGSMYSLAALAGGGIAAGDVLQVGESGHPGGRT